MSKLINETDLHFLLFDVFRAEEILELERYQDHDEETMRAVLDTARQIAEEQFQNHNAKADANEPQFDGERVTTIPEVKEAWKAFSEAGFLNARHDYQWDGMQLPALFHAACNAYFMSANPSTAGYPFLTCAAANVIEAFGSEDQKQRYLPGMFSGQSAGTMALTEPNVGSSLGDLTTKAYPKADGSYRIKGQKMYISGGDQDITENIVHLVLARVDGADQGVKGISMFIVPKVRQNAETGTAERNDVALAGLLHKMGYRGTTSTVLSFGEKDDCYAELVGEEGKGLSYMFKMMNEARIGVGLGGAMIGYRGYLESLDYAIERPQGRLPSERNPLSKPVAIIEHADVKRMLLAQKSYVEGSLALCLFASKLVDESETGNQEDSAILLDLLTPIVKSFPSYYGPRANDLAIQVLGGSGYIREYPVEQCYRDNRLNPIHEGTHGIQSLDLMGRKLWMHGGKGLQLLTQQIIKTIGQAKTVDDTRDMAEAYEAYLKPVQEIVAIVGGRLQTGDVDLTLANSSVFLDMMGKMVVAWLWLKMAHQAVKSFSKASDAEKDFMKGKCQAAQYFIQWELPEIEHQLNLLKRFDSTCYDMQTAWF